MPFMSGGKYLKATGRFLTNATVAPASSHFTRISSGLLVADDFANLSAWDNEGTWASVSDPSLTPYPIPRILLPLGSSGTSDSGSILDARLIVDDDTWYVYYAAIDDLTINTEWKVHAAKSIDFGKTWTRLGVMVGLDKGYTAGNYLGRDTGSLLKLDDTWYMHVCDGILIPQRLEGSIYTASSLEGTWTYASRDPSRGSAGSYNADWATQGVVILDSGTYHVFYTALLYSEGKNRIGRASSSSPTGPWTDHGSILPDGLLDSRGGNAPELFWSDTLGRWVLTINGINTISILNTYTSAYLSESLTDWSGAVRRDIQFTKLNGYGSASGSHASDIDTTQGDVMGAFSPFKLPDGSPFSDNQYIPFAYDGYPNDVTPDLQTGRKLLSGILEQSTHSLYYSGTTEKIIQHTVTHSDFVAEFVLKITAQTNADAQIDFLYRRASNVGSTVNGYQFAFVPSGSASAGIYLGKFVSGSYTQIAFTTYMQLQLNRQYRLRFEITGSNHKLYIDGVNIFDSTDGQFSSGATLAFKGYQCTGYVWGFHARTGNTVTINDAPASVSLHAPGDLYVDEDISSITHTHYPMRSLAIGANKTTFADGIYGGDVYEYNG